MARCRAFGPPKMAISAQPSSSNFSTRHSPGDWDPRKPLPVLSWWWQNPAHRPGLPRRLCIGHRHDPGAEDAISAIERPPISMLPSSISSASDQFLAVFTAGGSSSASAPIGSRIKVPIRRNSVSRWGFRGPLRNSLISISPDGIFASCLKGQPVAGSRARNQYPRWGSYRAVSCMCASYR